MERRSAFVNTRGETEHHIELQVSDLDFIWKCSLYSGVNHEWVFNPYCFGIAEVGFGPEPDSPMGPSPQ